MIDNQTQRVFFNNANGGWEYPAFLVIAALVQALLGDGALTLKSSASLLGKKA